MTTFGSNTPPDPAAPSEPEPISIVAGPHPPVVAGAVVTTRDSEPQWPAVLGIVAMVMGILAALNASTTACWTIVARPVFEWAGLADNPQIAPNLDVSTQHMGMLVTSSSIAVALGLLQAFAGWRLRQRRQLGVRWSIRWAWSKLAYAFFAAGTGAYLSMSQMAATKQQVAASGAPAFVVRAIEFSPILTLIFSIGWFSAFPVFMLFWFRRAAIRNDVSRWPA